MVKISGHELDLEKSSDGTNDFQWRLVFTPGEFQAPGVSKTVESVQFILKKTEYNYDFPKGYAIYYNPYTNKYQIVEKNTESECNDLGYNLGGFLISNCKMTFLMPSCNTDVEYIRTFEETFDQAFEKRVIECDEEYCGAFRDYNFNEGFEIDCPIVESDSEFHPAEFDGGFTNIPAP